MSKVSKKSSTVVAHEEDAKEEIKKEVRVWSVDGLIHREKRAAKIPSDINSSNILPENATRRRNDFDYGRTTKDKNRMTMRPKARESTNVLELRQETLKDELLQEGGKKSSSKKESAKESSKMSEVTRSVSRLRLKKQQQEDADKKKKQQEEEEEEEDAKKKQEEVKKKKQEAEKKKKQQEAEKKKQQEAEKKKKQLEEEADDEMVDAPEVEDQKGNKKQTRDVVEKTATIAPEVAPRESSERKSDTKLRIRKSNSKTGLSDAVLKQIKRLGGEPSAVPTVRRSYADRPTPMPLELQQFIDTKWAPETKFSSEQLKGQWELLEFDLEAHAKTHDFFQHNDYVLIGDGDTLVITRQSECSSDFPVYILDLDENSQTKLTLSQFLAQLAPEDQ